MRLHFKLRARSAGAHVQVTVFAQTSPFGDTFANTGTLTMSPDDWSVFKAVWKNKAEIDE